MNHATGFVDLRFLKREFQWPEGRPLAHLGAVLERVHYARGVSSLSEVDYSLARLSPPWGMKGLEAALGRLIQAKDSGEKVLIVGDYDVDGATGTALLVKGLRALGLAVDFYIPNRAREGYGFTPLCAKVAQTRGAALVVTVDNGISGHEGVLEARALGVDVIVTDHHACPEALPEALSILNPKQEGCAFPDKEIAGVSVAFYLLSALFRRLKERGEALEFSPVSLLDLVAIGTIADLVPMGEANRRLAELGLARIRSGLTGPGVLSLLSVSKVKEVSSEAIAFQVAPRLNAAGRLEEMSLGVRLLLSEDPSECGRIARELDSLNETRKRLERENFDLVSPGVADESGFVVVHDPRLHAGVIGIVASRLKSAHRRSAAVFTRNESGQWVGSLRGAPKVHLKHLLDTLHQADGGLFARYGGHRAAAGLTLSEGRSPQEFSSRLESALSAYEREDLYERDLLHDGALSALEVDAGLSRALKRIPFGSGFEAPLFFNEGMRVLAMEPLGKTGEHVKLRLVSPLWPSGVKALCFRFGAQGVSALKGGVLDVAYTLEEDQGSVCWVVKHLREARASGGLQSGDSLLEPAKVV